MEPEARYINKNRFIVKRSELNTLKLIVEFYLPEHQELISQLRGSPYPLQPLREISQRMFDGPFGSNRKVDMYQESGIPYIRVKDVLPGKIEPGGLTYISREKHEELGRSRVVPGNVLITIAGRLGTAAVFPEELVEGNITGHIAGIELKEGIDPHYLSLFLNSRFGESQVTRWGHRTTRPELNLRELGAILVTVPPLEVQEQIACLMQDAYATRQTKFTQASELIKQAKVTIEKTILNESVIEFGLKKKFYLTSIKKMQKANRFDVDYFRPDYTQLDDLFTAIPNVKPLGEIANIEYGFMPTEDYSTPEDGLPLIRVTNIQADSSIDMTDTKYVRLDSSRLQNKLVKENDILMVQCGNTTGKVALVPKDLEGCAYASFCFRIRPLTQQITPGYLLAVLHSNVGLSQVWRSITYATVRPNTTKPLTQALQIPIPSLEVQNKVTELMQSSYANARSLRNEGENAVQSAKLVVECLILGEDKA